MCGSMGEDDRVDVDEALHAVLQRGDGTLSDVRSWMEQRARAPRVSRALRRWTEGPVGALFSRPTNVKVDADFVAFGLRDLKEEMLPVAYFLIAQWIWARVRSIPRPRRILFDEVGLLFEYPLVRRFLVRLARRLRKYQGSLCLVTQNAGDLLGSDQGLVLATNPSTLVLGAQRHAEAVRLQRAFGLTDGQTDFLANARRGEFLMLAGETRQRLKVVVPPWLEETSSFPAV
jgi:type IV secretory pathway VirB4 component